MHTTTAEFGRLPYELRSQIEAELTEGEWITWAGAPNPWRLALRNLHTILFATVWIAFLLFGILQTSTFEFSGSRLGTGLLFMLVGAAIMSPLFWVLQKARKTAYVLTTARAIIFDGGFLKTIHSFSPGQLDYVQLKKGRAGSGDLIFERKRAAFSEKKSIDIGFLAIPNVEAVEELVLKLADKSPDKVQHFISDTSDE